MKARQLIEAAVPGASVFPPVPLKDVTYEVAVYLNDLLGKHTLKWSGGAPGPGPLAGYGARQYRDYDLPEVKYLIGIDPVEGKCIQFDATAYFGENPPRVTGHPKPSQEYVDFVRQYGTSHWDPSFKFLAHCANQWLAASKIQMPGYIFQDDEFEMPEPFKSQLIQPSGDWWRADSGRLYKGNRASGKIPLTFYIYKQ